MKHDEDDSEAVDCLICLDAMTQADHRHALQCHCGFNMCRSCIESLITSSKDDYMEASDGNYHVKVFLNCPNCRSNLSESIRDTVLLRRADAVWDLVENEDVDNLTASQLRMKRALQDDPEVQLAVEEAERREDAFFGRSFSSKISRSRSNEDSQDEEWGVEADIIQGVHKSFRMPPPPKPTNAESFSRKKKIDTTLLAGLEFYMKEEEQEYVTAKLTSGEPTKLAEAAVILQQVSDLCRSPNSQLRQSALVRRQRKSSVYMLIEESREAHSKAKPPTTAILTNNKVTAAEHRQAALQLAEEADFFRFHPLPVRMPKSVQLSLQDAQKLSFCDDTWNGTVMDAFSKISISNWGKKITKKETNHPGVRYILDGGFNQPNMGPIRIDMEQPRVLIASVSREAGHQGVLKGDVVTHIDGEEFRGTAAALVELLLENHSDVSVRLVLNACNSTAEALKRRSLVD